MVQGTSWSKVVFFYEKGVFRREVAMKPFGFHVGIWWHDSERLVAFVQSIDEIQAIGHLADSELSHDCEWKLARQEFLSHATAEYFEIPRGRIVWDRLHATGRIYHGNSTPKKLFEELVRLYGLPRWESRLDEHYLTGEALEEFYRLE